MSKRLIPSIALVAIILGVATIWMLNSPKVLSPCEVMAQPKSFDQKPLSIRGTLNVEFENFSFDAGNCGGSPGIWLAFGGDVPGIVVSTANDVARKPGVNIQVNERGYEIKKDENFRKLYALIAARRGEDSPAYRVTATLTGTFFAGHQTGVLPGYGHLGCCFLFVITEIADVESEPPANLQLTGILLGPDGRPAQGLTVFNDVVGGAPPQRQEAITNDKGEFTFSNSGQLLRFENPMYRPVALLVEPGGKPVRVTLEDSRNSDWSISQCRAGRDRTARIGHGILFTLPKEMEFESFDMDDAHTYFVFSRGSSPSDAELIISKPATAGLYLSPSDFKSSHRRWLKNSAGSVVGIDSQGESRTGYQWRIVEF